MIPFIDLQAQRLRLAGKIEAAVQEAVVGGAWVMGPQVRQFEADLAAFGRAKHALGCANGTDALALPLMAWGIGRGDAVFVPSFTFAATAEVVPWFDAEPVFVDVDADTYNMDPVALERAIEGIKAEGRLTPRVVIAVDLFGQPADYPAIRAICDKHGLKLIADSAQGFGCTIGGEHPLKWADITTTSFFPAKPLGCYGDGGAVLTDDDELAQLIDSVRVHGKAVAVDLKDRVFDHDPKYLNMRIGLNSRLDTIQAAVLIEKLKVFGEEITWRNRIAARYNEGLRPHVAKVPDVPAGNISNWAQYTVEHPDRDGLIAHLKAHDVPTAVYYPIPLHLQPAYAHFPRGAGGLPVTERLKDVVFSLPMHADLDEATQDKVIAAVASYKGQA
ncbi:MAG: DegT/DnrJ/EryC1/StrS aminotransferase family protein [Alphaproteobacteria bacterium]|uniref:DegT/DnrJ/EryC1/StrS family aminotransferase n=1 Tax=Brevundimonas sp. TaxID=1871086 RepID=UPI001D5E2797|nr:DegT/DnrJ/EryC1/StrS aminotransferase family protein [Alphaproteobacteria bacterium]MBU1520105.1 DegT/DnrJ/EryC1/StrS aminotransferase family protein [Alphaproteobacteria bacterium]MBU2232988.1 DegT/DnrJ/EryC1/StrS aminotransferase family protein [Alphaproteobacteria bacterium]MBU2349442.1 DegT/DnrJ/EryC1/StrS aminotransferase family protein [Alphaproteobacteria bacterium]MBU2400004.1 DegT/DnrJ/EryC1/StrS aminotransferase family protein [Alphaproteobacteria bacterium]